LSARTIQSPSRCVQRAALPAGLLSVGSLLAPLRGVDALRAAGLSGTAPAQGASLFQTLISTLESNEKWLFFTGFSLGLTTVALMFFLGSMRAPDYLFKMLGAVVLILIITPAVLA
jgi:hypothetical protein